MSLHTFAAIGDLTGLRAAIADGASLEAFDANGQTALMAAVASPRANVEVVRLLIEYGANVNACTAPVASPLEGMEQDPFVLQLLTEHGLDLNVFKESVSAQGQSVLGIAAKSARLEKIKSLVEAGADVNYVDPSGYSILVNAVHRSVVETADEHLEVLDFLIASGAPLDAVSKHGESLLNVLSSRGDIAKVQFVLERGVNPEPLGWTPFFFAVAFGRQPEVIALLEQGASLTQRDRWERTPFLLSVEAGHHDIAKLLLEHGSDRAATGRCGQTALMYAIARDDASMLSWLIAQGWDVEESDDLGHFPLGVAVQASAAACVAVLLEAGATASRRDEHGHGVMSEAETPEIVDLLVAAGEDLGDISRETRSRLAGHEPTHEIKVSEPAYRRFRNRRFGRRNPERMNNEFWDEMVRSRANAYAATSLFDDLSIGREPAWSFQRFGQSITRLPDGRYVEIGGEHEDFYDPDFCIYNDVVIHHGDGTFDILGYPESVFPPTDFHSATFLAPYIYIIGNLSYRQNRRPGETPLFRLHCKTWAIERVPSRGENPGWIHSHKATLITNQQIKVQGGMIDKGTDDELVENQATYLLDLADFTWRRDASPR